MWVIAVVFVISAFIAGKAWEKSNRNELIKMAMDNYHKTMEPVYTEKFKEFVHKEWDGPFKSISEFAKTKINEEKKHYRKKNVRIRSNKEFEMNQAEQCRIPKPDKVSDEAFQLWALLTNNHEMERSLELDGQIQTVCQRITEYLLPHELDVLFQIDREVCEEAKKLSSTIDMMSCFQRFEEICNEDDDE